MVEGRYPNFFVSYKMTNMVGTQIDYVKNKGLDKDVYRQLIINILGTMESAKTSEIKEILQGALPAIMDEKQQESKVFNILQSMNRDGIVDVRGTGHAAKWFLAKMD